MMDNKSYKVGKKERDHSEDKIDKIAKLKKQRDILNARIQKAEALEKSRERKRDTRRKILVGAYYLDQARKNGTLDELGKIMDDYLTRDSDRKLFDRLDNNE